PEPVDVLGSQSDILEGKLEHVADAAVGARLFSVISQVNSGIENLPGREQPVGIVDEAAVGVLEKLLQLLAFDRLSVDEALALAGIDIEINGKRRAGLVCPRDPIVSGVAIPDMLESRDRLAFAVDDEGELELSRLFPGALTAERRDELFPDRVRLGIAIGASG